MNPICSQCQETQWSIMDKKYLELFEHCWSCDRKDWLANRLTTEEFERRERQVLGKEEEIKDG